MNKLTINSKTAQKALLSFFTLLLTFSASFAQCVEGDIVFNNDHFDSIIVNGQAIDITTIGDGTYDFSATDLISYNGTVDGATQLAAAIESVLGLPFGAITITSIVMPNSQPILNISGLPAGTLIDVTSSCSIGIPVYTEGGSVPCSTVAPTATDCAEGEMFFNCDVINSLTVGGQTIDLTTIGNGDTDLGNLDFLATNGNSVDGESQLTAAIESALGLNPGSLAVSVVNTTSPFQTTMTITGLPLGTTIEATSDCKTNPTFSMTAYTTCTNVAAVTGQCEDGTLNFNCDEIYDLTIGGQTIDLTTLGDGDIYFDLLDISAYNNGATDGEGDLATAIETALGLTAGTVTINATRVFVPSYQIIMDITGLPQGTTVAASSECSSNPTYSAGTAYDCNTPNVGPQCIDSNISTNGCFALSGIIINGVPVNFGAVGNGDNVYTAFDHSVGNPRTEIATEIETILGLTPGTITVTPTRTVTTSPRAVNYDILISGLPAGTTVTATTPCITTPTITYSQIGNCGTPQAFKTDNSISLINKLEMNVFPNPTVGSFQLTCNECDSSVQSVVIYNINGKVVAQREYAVNGFNNDRFDLSTQPAGLYNVIVISETGTQSYKVYKQ